ncbi:MAG TPA: DNA polymerase III subunit beta [Chloroflexi bacterium]|nr:DNA polymerase III subunit beta [Chloroflexota bacterium]
MSEQRQQSLTLTEIRARLREMLPQLREQYHVQSLAVFGSYVRGEADRLSDLDLLVTFDQPPSLLQFMAMEYEISDALGVKVDLVMQSALKPRIGKRILDEAVEIA